MPLGSSGCGCRRHGASNLESSRPCCRTAPPWFCARCTLSNPPNVVVCQVCEAARPVEIDAAEESPGIPPHRRCERKRWERAASPDVLEVCADDGDPADGGDNRATAANKDKTFKIMTYNVWFREDIEVRRRMDALGGLVQYHSPDLICFQEITPYIYQLLQSSNWWQEYKCSLSSEEAMRRHYYCMQLSRFPAKFYGGIPFSNSTMGRELCKVDVNPGQHINLMLATSHLESPCPAPPRWDQMHRRERVMQANEALRILGAYSNVIFCGDMNWDDKGDGPFPLPDGWVDPWLELKPGENGWTYDTEANDMLSGNRNEQKRLDRFVCKLVDFKIKDIEIIGQDVIPGALYHKDKIVDKEFRRIDLSVLPSDHFGLVLTVSHRN
uniref:Uncharacterized protein n=1 Tax=Avena sativa TaxID=4498 RepID=A0ACD5YJP8_AVESA